MNFKRTAINDVVICEPIVHGDERGYFVETLEQIDQRSSQAIRQGFEQDGKGKEFLRVTPLKKEGERAIAICKDSITDKSNNINILITGSKGQLSSELQEISANYKHNFFFTCRDDLDISDERLLDDFLEKNIKLIHISTDYVFDGTTCRPYVECQRREDRLAK